jgi:endonuclease-3
MKTTASQRASKSASQRAGKTVATAKGKGSAERVRAILRGLAKLYPEAECALVHKSAWELVAATILSAQCTDVRVNMVTPELFRMWPTAAALAGAPQAAVEQVIRSTGFYRNKAKSLIGAARVVTERFGGVVPQTMDELLEMPGVARKTANVVLGTWFKKSEGVVVDTHVKRISRRLGLTKATEPVKIERDLVKILPRERWTAFSHEIIQHGRRVCVARKPRCAECGLEKLCSSKDKTYATH